MSEVSTSIGRVIEVARRLREIADEIKNIELKSQIVDEISTLQELREQLSNDDTKTIATRSAPTAAPAMEREAQHGKYEGSRSGRLASDVSMRVIEPTGDSGTYSLHVEEDPPEVDEEPAIEVAPQSPSVKTPGPKAAVAPKPPTPEQVAAIAELRIAELEQFQQAAIKKQNEILTAEQTRLRIQSTKEAKESGKTGKEAAQFVYEALKLSPEQKAQWLASRKELQTIREAIAKQVQFLLSDEQKEVIQE